MTFALRNSLWGGAPILAALAMDQATKAAVIAEAERLSVGVPVLPGFNLVFLRNEGVTFGLFGQIPWWALSVIAFGVSLWLLHLMLTTTKRIEAVACGMIVGGALGNIADRMRFGAVTDFLDLYMGSWHWPAFNFADVAVVCGVSLLILHPLLTNRSSVTARRAARPEDPRRRP